jgi:hypothetical protein
VSPFVHILPDWLPAEELLSLLLVLAIFIAIGASVGTGIGKGVRNWIEKTVFERIPGYTFIRSLMHQVAGQSRGSTWKAALVEIEDALVPAFIIEELEDGRLYGLRPSRLTAVCRCESTCSTGNGCARSTSRSPTRSKSSPGGARVRRTWLRL